MSFIIRDFGHVRKSSFYESDNINLDVMSLKMVDNLQC